MKDDVIDNAVPVEFAEFIDIHEQFDASFKQFEKIFDILDVGKDPMQTLVRPTSVSAAQRELSEIPVSASAQWLVSPIQVWTSSTTRVIYAC